MCDVVIMQVGWYVTLHIEDVPVSVMESFEAGKPLVLVSLLPHEQKVSEQSIHSFIYPSINCTA